MNGDGFAIGILGAARGVSDVSEYGYDEVVVIWAAEV